MSNAGIGWPSSVAASCMRCDCRRLSEPGTHSGLLFFMQSEEIELAALERLDEPSEGGRREQER
jgi:hypothetical protein